MSDPNATPRRAQPPPVPEPARDPVEQYQRFADTVGLVPSLRLSDQVTSLIGAVGGGIVGAVGGYFTAPLLEMETVTGVIVGIIAGMLLGLAIASVVAYVLRERK